MRIRIRIKYRINIIICRLFGHAWRYGHAIHVEGRQCRICNKKQRMVAKDTWDGLVHGFIDDGIEWNRQNMHLAEFNWKY